VECCDAGVPRDVIHPPKARPGDRIAVLFKRSSCSSQVCSDRGRAGPAPINNAGRAAHIDPSRSHPPRTPAGHRAAFSTHRATTAGSIVAGTLS